MIFVNVTVMSVSLTLRSDCSDPLRVIEGTTFGLISLRANDNFTVDSCSL